MAHVELFIDIWNFRLLLAFLKLLMLIKTFPLGRKTLKCNPRFLVISYQ